MTWQDNVENLIKIGQLKKTPYVAEDVQQYVANARAYLQDARTLDYPGSRFQLAYEGMHALSLAVLNKAGVRSETSQGHRQVAFQTALLIINIDGLQKGAAGTIMNLHRRRNSDTYHAPFPPLSAAEANAAVKGLELMLEATSQFLAKPEA